MKNKGFFIGTILGMIACMVVEYLSLLIDMNLVFLTVLFIIPIGGILIGMIIGYGAKVGMTLDNQSCETWHKTVVGICGVFSIIAAMYVDYATYYLTAEGPNRFFKGSHVSEVFGHDFLKFIKTVYLNGSMTFRFKGGVELPVNSETLAAIIFVLQFVGAAVGAVLILTTIKGKEKCPVCDKYLKTKEVDRFFASMSVDQVAAEVSKELSEERFYTQHHLKAADYTYSVRVHYCKDCRTGQVVIMKRTKSGRNEQFVRVGSYKIGEGELFKFQLVD